MLNSHLEDILAPLLEPAAATVRKAANALVQFSDAVNKWWQANKEQFIVAQYGNGRVRHLALHAKKKRVRKKNVKRILKEFYRR